MLNVPNLISGFRLVIIPVLLCLAWIGEHTLFLIFLTYSLLSDLVDGFIARKLNQVSELGAKLDSWSDFITNMTIPLCAWWLWPDIIWPEASFVITMVVSHAIPAVFGFLKYGHLIGYRTWGSKLSTALVCSTALILFAGGPAWPFRLSAPVLVLAELEKIAITALFPEWQSNVPSLWYAIKLPRRLNRLKHGNRVLEYKDL